ncbi:MAG TPA: cysteine desulfurase family protein [Pseudolabrys sp.]|uniref:cysteine desulfurase family protein n=1 Tax=Pseudolabrys sp. TaxID=1960880 RepID=UPI002DDD72B7|nr:cysteine desulfurase family protein [Pseudolabrys sp.]HEV2627802.1 cysteine desulfurase family protein [Pseudolabrys sp.]
MTADRAYFDWNATAPLRPAARAAMLAALDAPGNASSVHGEGRGARRLIEEARRQVAALAGAEAKQVTFVGGATEANALALTPAIEADGNKAPRDRLFVSAVEHPSVLAGGRFAPEQVEILPVDRDGRVDPATLAAALAKAERPLVSVMLANNETGVIQPIAEIAGIVHAANGLLHIDAVQAAGRIPLDMSALGADLMSLSSHKLGGPQGAGALIVRGRLSVAPLIRGGGQERGIRAGTENVAAIAGFGAAAEAARASLATDAARMAALRDRLEAGLRAATPDAVIFAAGVNRLPNTTLVAVPGIKAETALIAFDLNGIAVSSGSACSSGKVAASHVVAAMGMEPALARGAIRISLGPMTTETQVESLLIAWKRVVPSLLKNQPNQGLAA